MMDPHHPRMFAIGRRAEKLMLAARDPPRLTMGLVGLETAIRLFLCTVFALVCKQGSKDSKKAWMVNLVSALGQLIPHIVNMARASLKMSVYVLDLNAAKSVTFVLVILPK